VASRLLDRILRESGVADLLEVLSTRLEPTDLQSLLLAVYARRAADQTPSDLLRQFERSRFTRPSSVDPRALAEVDRLAYALASPPIQPLELSPVCPLGSNSVVAPVSQNLAVATIRNTEVVSDSTNVLALECALRRRANVRTAAQARDRVKLCASHRLLRPQHFDQPGFFAHFRVFALCTAGRDEGGHRFELESLAEQLTLHLRLMAALAGIGYPLKQPRVAITDLAGGIDVEALRTAVMDPLAHEFPDAEIGFDPGRTTGRGYYQGLCFKIYARDQRNVEHDLGDGGFTTWTQTFCSDRKERLLISGIGTERVCSVFAPMRH
jgi:hypothetical protein